MQTYLRRWAVAEEEIDRLKCEELRNLTPEQSAKRINDLMLMADHWLELTENRDRVSGLVEQQMYFKKWRTDVVKLSGKLP